MIGVVTRKHDLLTSEILSHKTEVEEIKNRAQNLIDEGWLFFFLFFGKLKISFLSRVFVFRQNLASKTSHSFYVHT